jgi:hypothetical protein
MEVATLFSLRRAVRNGSVWVEHSLVYSGADARLFFTHERCSGRKLQKGSLCSRLYLPAKASRRFWLRCLARVRAWVLQPSPKPRVKATLRVDDELHSVQRWPPRTKTRKWSSSYAPAWTTALGEVQLPDVILAVGCPGPIQLDHARDVSRVRQRMNS